MIFVLYKGIMLIFLLNVCIYIRCASVEFKINILYIYEIKVLFIVYI